MEWGHIFGILTLVLGFLSLKKTALRNRMTTIVLFLSSVLFLIPLVSAVSVEKANKLSFEREFGSISDKSAISFLQLFSLKTARTRFKTFKYSIKNNLDLDFYQSSKQPLSPCVIVIHGGGWDSGDSHQLQELNSELSLKGYNVASINYRLAPKFRYPDPVDDVKDAINFLIKNAVSLRIDTSRFALLGRSAGGQIALQAAYTLNNKNIKGVIAFYTPADMVWGYSLPGNPLVLDSRKVLCDYIGGPCEQFPDKFKASSPVEHVTSSSPPTLMIHGKKDVLVAYEHNLHLIEKLKSNKVKYALITLPWATHGFDFNLNGPGGQISTYYVEQFLEKVL